MKQIIADNDSRVVYFILLWWQYEEYPYSNCIGCPARNFINNTCLIMHNSINSPDNPDCTKIDWNKFVLENV